MIEEFSFDQIFGLTVHDRFEPRFLISLSLSIIFFMIIILVVANIDYSRLNEEADKAIFSRYKSMVASLVIEAEIRSSHATTLAEPETSTSLPDSTTKAPTETAEYKKLAEKRGMPEVKNIPGLLDMSARLSAGELRGYSRYSTGQDAEPVFPADIIKGSGIGSVNELIRDSFSYSITRQGKMSIKTTSELRQGPKEKRGFRDQTEIEYFVRQRQVMIEYCFRKEARKVSGLHGYVQIQFKISYMGYVLPESIRILNSTVRNKKVEQCIKNYVKRWRNFRVLDESMGIATVVQKFVYN